MNWEDDKFRYDSSKYGAKRVVFRMCRHSWGTQVKDSPANAAESHQTEKVGKT